MFVKRHDNVVAELGRVKQAAREAGDKGESEPTEKYEQICKSPGHCCIITPGFRISVFGFRIPDSPFTLTCARGGFVSDFGEVEISGHILREVDGWWADDS